MADYVLKEQLYSADFFNEFAIVLNEIVPQFDQKQFLDRIFDREWPNRELKERMRHTSEVLHAFFPEEFPLAAKLLIDIADKIITKTNDQTEGRFGYICLADYVELYGLDYYDESILALEKITQLISAEFAIRPFIKKYPKKTLNQMLKWSKHNNPQIRRLSSEGCRPRLPWAMALPDLKKNPEPILPILENLKNDPAETVRKSVANNLNDISKDNPEVTLQIASQWIGNNPQTDWIVKHACRTLLKQGHPKALTLFGFDSVDGVDIQDLALNKKQVKMGDKIQFSFDIINNTDQVIKLRLEYAVDYVKSRGKLSRKIFQIKEDNFAVHEKRTFTRSLDFKPITTRKYYPGQHKIIILVNGLEQAELHFMLIE